MRRIIYSTRAIDESEDVLEQIDEENHDWDDVDGCDRIQSSSAADYMLQEERDMQDFSLPASVDQLPEEMSFREFCYEFYSVTPDDLTDEDYDSLFAKYDHYYDGWDLRPEFRN